MDARGLIIMVVIGLVAGWLASLVMGGGGLIRYIITGLIGSVVGSLLLHALGVNISLGNPLISQILVAAIGAIVVIAVARVVA
ncbi:GlsB/YeaQ/YmgE family stress response membrane protein [Terrarubrum flagellatum]|uniref:GlsB/YeaQ/YmgE family stress response membrane protein n=1 Tax=Terrirubrum flagellatum TaxID=2895980 RepID=UPI003144E0C1